MRKDEIPIYILTMLLGWFTFTYLIPIQVTDGEYYHGACPQLQKVDK